LDQSIVQRYYEGFIVYIFLDVDLCREKTHLYNNLSITALVLAIILLMTAVIILSGYLLIFVEKKGSDINWKVSL